MALKKGITKKALKHAAIALTAVCAVTFFILAYAYPIDSNIVPNPAITNYPHTTTNTPLLDNTTPALLAPYGKPFLLESGNSNVNNQGASAVDGSAGAYQFVTCSGTGMAGSLSEVTNYYGNGNDLAICIARLSTTKTCPKKGFVPIIKITPASTTSSPFAPIFACLSEAPGGPYGTGVQDNPASGGYLADFITPATSSTDGSQWQPFVSINWETWCYPTTQRNINYPNINKPNLQECNITAFSGAYPLNTYPLDMPVVLWDNGTTAVPSQSNPQNRFQTNRMCPPQWQPYIVMKLTGIDGLGSDSSPTGAPGVPALHDSVGSSGICVTNIAPQATNYQITFYAQAAITQLTYNSSSLTVTPATQAPDINILWDLYCYPPNLSPPALDASCTH